MDAASAPPEYRYEGPAAKALGNADISFFIGLPVAAGLYYVFAR